MKDTTFIECYGKGQLNYVDLIIVTLKAFKTVERSLHKIFPSFAFTHTFNQPPDYSKTCRFSTFIKGPLSTTELPPCTRAFKFFCPS